MFNRRTAWFSNSVEEEKKILWSDYGGLTDTFALAEYIFSEDAECDDTKGIFESSPYLDECLSIFHPAYICECVKYESRENVKIGKYFFPPTEIQDYMRREGMPFGWEPDGSEITCVSASGSVIRLPSIGLQSMWKSSKLLQKYVVWSTGVRKQGNTWEERPEPRVNVNREKPQTNIIRTSPRFVSNVKPSTSKQSEPQQSDIEDRTENNHTGKNVRNDSELNKSKTRFEQGKNSTGNNEQHNKVDSRVAVSTPRQRKKTDNSVNEIADSSAHVDTIVRDEQDEHRTKKTVVHKWNGKEVLRLQDLSKVTGAWIPFTVGENKCEFERL